MSLDPCSMFVLGSAIEVDVPKYAKGTTYSSEPSYLPGFGPSEPAKTSWWPWIVGALAVGGAVWLATRGGGMIANPALPDGRAKRVGFTARDADPKELARGTKHEMEHTRDKKIARQIALDHLAEDEGYYEKLDAMERSTFRNNP